MADINNLIWPALVARGCRSLRLRSLGSSGEETRKRCLDPRPSARVLCAPRVCAREQAPPEIESSRCNPPANYHFPSSFPSTSPPLSSSLAACFPTFHPRTKSLIRLCVRLNNARLRLGRRVSLEPRVSFLRFSSPSVERTSSRVSMLVSVEGGLRKG